MKSGCGEKERKGCGFFDKLKLFIVSILELKVNYINLRKIRGRFYNFIK